MSYIMKTNIARKENYGSKRSTSAIKWIVIHYTANDGDHDESNAAYFHTNVVKASAHYFVDDDSVTQSVPDNYAAYSVGGSKYSDCTTTGGGKYYKIATNANTLNVELCDTVKDGKIMPTESTLANASELVRVLMKRYGINVDHVIRHFDVNGKHCPAYFMNPMEWQKFKDRLVNPTQTFHSFKVRVSITDLNIRTGPGTNYAKTGHKATPGVYTITEVKNGSGSNSGWGKLLSGAGWIALDYTAKC